MGREYKPTEASIKTLDWKKCFLSDILEEISDKNNKNLEIPVLSVTNSKWFVEQKDQFERSIHSKDLKKYKIIQKYDFGYNPSRINVGSIAQLNTFDRWLVSPIYFVFRCRNWLSPIYFNHYIKSSFFSRNNEPNYQWSVRKSLSFDGLSRAEFVLPPEHEQSKISDILSSLNELIDRTDKIIENQNKLKEWLLNKLMKEGIGNSDFKDSKLGRIPKDWEVMKLSEMIEKKIILSHLDGNHWWNYPKSSEFMTSWIPYLVAWNIKSWKIDFSKTKFLSLEKANKLTKWRAIDNDIIFAHNATVWPVGILHTDLNYVILSTSLTYYRCNTKELLPEYLLTYMQSSYFVNQYERVMKQSTRNQIPITTQRTFYFILPSKEEQEKISKITSTINQTIEEEQEYKNQLVILKTWLMGKLLTGEIRVKI